MWLVNEGMIRRIVFQFVYSHCGVERNEAVDREVAILLQNVKHIQHTAPISLKASKTHIKTESKKKWLHDIKPDSERYMTCKNSVTDLTDKSHTRSDQTLLARLRVGECHPIGKFPHRIGTNPTGKCRWCKKQDETVYHVYQTCNARKIAKLNKELCMQGSSSLVNEGTKALSFFKQAIALMP